MAWDWEKTIGNNSNVAAISNAENQSSCHREHSGTRQEQQTDKAAGTRCDAGIILHSTEQMHAVGKPGDPPRLLYGKEYDCVFCRGTGQLPNESVCPVCRGSGKVSVSAPAVWCAFCKGRGQVPPRSTLTCCVCKGSGIVPVRPPIQLCPDCKGRGKKRGQSLYCSRCRGAGVITSPRCGNDSSGTSSDIESQPELGRKAS